MNFIRKHKTISIIVMVFLSIFVVLSFTAGRYIKNIINSYILETKAFYFNSTVLGVNGKNYVIRNWDGVNSYNLMIDLNNRKNDKIHTNFDIEYEVTVSCPETVTCHLNKTSGVIHPDTNEDNYQITVNPIASFHEGDDIRVTTTATSKSPYRKSMSATYIIQVETSKFSYEIKDKENDKYLKIIFTNSVPFYKVSEAFSTYQVGDLISLDAYKNLGDNQSKCYSAIVTVEYDPNTLLVDMTNNNYLNRLDSPYQEQTINGYQWVSKFAFKVDASSSNEIIFYKNNPSMDYTYPKNNNSSIINVTVQLAN